MQPVLTRLDRWLAAKRKRFHANLQSGAGASDLAALQKTLDRAVPAQLQELLAWHNGQGDDYVGYFEEHWLLMSAAQIAAAKSELDQTADEQGWNKDWLPFLDDDGGDFVCLDLSQREPAVVVFWMGKHAEKKASSLEAWLSEMVDAMESGRYHEDPERGTFKRSAKKQK